MESQPNSFMNAAAQSSLKPSQKRSHQGFTLVEMLVILSIASILSLLVSAGFQSILGSVENGQVSDIASTLARARAYAMANNTYVFVGIQEVDASNVSTVTQTAGTGRIGVSVVASNDGTRIYDYTAPGALTAARLTTVAPLRHYDNLHITTIPVNATLPNATSGTTYNLASSSGATLSTSLTTFQWPLSGTAQYSFGNNASSPGTVIQFNPQGQAQIVTGAFTDSVLQWIEIDLTPTHGTTISGKNPATILIDGASGSVSVYRA
jgi:prepilin-type N-terminal cleavage/methylation domain-containing protein